RSAEREVGRVVLRGGGQEGSLAHRPGDPRLVQRQAGSLQAAQGRGLHRGNSAKSLGKGPETPAARAVPRPRARVAPFEATMRWPSRTCNRRELPDRSPVAVRGRSSFADYLVLSYAGLALHVAAFARGHVGDLLSAAFAFAVCATYAALYLAPLALVCGLGALVPPRMRAPRGVAIGLAVSVGAALHALVLGDRVLFQLYGFHLNGFVWNLVTT